jgi:VIT1/CCC1 family predicted Fe2+/Mn2+ transporter
MGAGEYLSDSDAGLTASSVIGATTGIGTLLPVLPYIFNMRLALVVSISLCLLVASGISVLKAKTDTGSSLLQSAAQTMGVLALATTVILLCAWATGAVG